MSAKNDNVIVLNGVTITPEAVSLLGDWFGKKDNPHYEPATVRFVQTLVKVQDILIDRLEETYPEIDKDLFDILASVKLLRIDLQSISIKKTIENE